MLVSATLADRPFVIVAVAAAWGAAGLLIAWVMSRRGHAARPVGALGLVLGPLLLGFALANLRWRERTASPVVVRPPGPLGGSERVLLALRREPGGAADALPVLRSRREELGAVWIGCAVDYEDADDVDGGREESDAHRDAVKLLEQAAVFLEELQPGLVLLPGRFEDAVCRFLDSDAADVVVIADDAAAQTELCGNPELRTITLVRGATR